MSTMIPTIEDRQEGHPEASGERLEDGHVIMTPTITTSVQHRPETVENAGQDHAAATVDPARRDVGALLAPALLKSLKTLGNRPLDGFQCAFANRLIVA